MGRAGAVVLGLLLVAVATALQMFVDWEQAVRDPSTTPLVRAAILGAGALSILAVLLGISAKR
jgi:hypothetical protein